MELTLKRGPASKTSTPGMLYVDGMFECHTLEDLERTVKIKGETAIPKGRYKIIINQSTHFNRLLPLLLDVPEFTGVRIHPGNTAHDTEGCILVGDQPAFDFLGKSRPAFERLFKKLQTAFDANEEIHITIGRV